MYLLDCLLIVSYVLWGLTGLVLIIVFLYWRYKDKLWFRNIFQLILFTKRRKVTIEKPVTKHSIETLLYELCTRLNEENPQSRDKISETLQTFLHEKNVKWKSISTMPYEGNPSIMGYTPGPNSKHFRVVQKGTWQIDKL